MFKCCVCNKSSRKEKPLNGEQTTGKSSFSQSGNKVADSSARTDGEMRDEKTKEKAANGGVQRCEKPVSVSSPVLVVKENHLASLEKSTLGDEREKQVETIAEKKDEEERIVLEIVVGEEEEEVVGTMVGKKDEEERIVVEIVEGEAVATMVGKTVEKKDSRATTKGGDGIGGSDGNERNEREEGGIAVLDVLDNAETTIPFATNTNVTKSNLYDASAYIERTIDDGPEEEGDDSVFESCPNENENEKTEKLTTVSAIPRWLSEEEEADPGSEGCSGMQEPPATPVARDELALRRHRFFSDLLQATQNSSEHRVRFDPLGPMVHAGCEASDREEHLEDLVNRLENVTKRLERVPSQSNAQTQETAVQTNTPSPKKPQPVLSRNAAAASPSSSAEKVTRSEPSNMSSIAGYEDLLAGPVKEFLQLSEKIGGDVATHSRMVEKAFQIQLQFIQLAASRPAPTNQSEQISLLAPTSTQIQRIQEFSEKNRNSPFFNHLAAIAGSIPALGWVAVTPTPAPYVKEMNDAGQFYTNRVLKDWKEKDKTHVDWCKAWIQALIDLQQYVRQYHTTGLIWAKAGSAPVGIPPPPPPSMPLPDVAALNVNDDRSALFAEINQGEAITKNLKKVTSDMQTHKNPSLRTGPAPFKAPILDNAIPTKIVPPANAPIDKAPVFMRDGKKWLVEYHKGNKELLIDNVEMNNVVYMFRCQDSTMVVKGKVNSIVMDSCRKSSVVFDSVVSSIEFVNCQSVQMQVLGKVPTISIDKTDGCQMYLNSDSLDVELITSKSSEMNVMVPKGNGDYAEYPVPEQFKTTISPKGLSTIAVDSLG